MCNNKIRFLVVFFILSPLFIPEFPFAQDRGKPIQVQTEKGDVIDLYEGSYAIVIANDEYATPHFGQQKLEYPVKDAEEVGEALRKQGFDVRVEKNLTADKFKDVFVRFFNEHGEEEKNRLLFYYSGHGYAEKDPYDSEKTVGYLIMTDTPSPEDDRSGFDLKSITLEWIESVSEKKRSHHVLFMFDSCFSGSIFDAMRGSTWTEHISDSIRQPVRQFISAGRSGETVPDKSEFKRVFLELLSGEYPEVAADRYLTGSELGQHLYQKVVNCSIGQHPQYGKSRNPKLNKGDFVFLVKTDRIGEVRNTPSCMIIETMYPPVFPHSLKNTIPTEDYPYWFFVNMENRCQDDIFFDVSFDLIYGPGIINNKEMTYTVRSGNKFSQNVPLPISFSKPDIDDMLTVTWSIHKSTDKTLIRQGTANIQIIPKFQYCWNLMRYDEQPVSKNFLLACLTAWSQYGDTNLKEFAQKMIKGIQRRDTPDKSTYEWFKTCYSLFQCTDGIEITPIAAFPPTDCQKISPSVNVWEEKLSNPLEAALFIGALTEKSFAYKRFGMRTVMFIFPQTAASPQQTFCFSWSVDGVNWKAVNMEHANSMTFEDNEKQTTMKLKSLLEKKAEILNALEEKGVYIGDATYAVDFKKAAEKFGIRSLP